MTADPDGGTGAAPRRMRPVLVGGCPRSGTTLVGAMLGVGPDVLTVPEGDFKRSLLTVAQVGSGDLDRASVVRHLSQERRFMRWAVDPAVLASTGTAPYADVVDDVVRAHGRQVGKPEPIVWVDHTPWNLKYAQTLGALLPTAQFVHVVRDGRAVAASVRRLDWGPSTIDAAATWWAAQIALGLAAEQSLGPTRVVRVRYEDLVHDPQRTLSTLQARLGLAPDPQGIHRRDFVVDSYTQAQHALVGSPPDPRRVDAWRQVLTARQVETFERRTGDLLEMLGYDPCFGARARSPGFRRHALELVGGGVRRALLDRRRRRRRERDELVHPPAGRRA